MRLRRRPRAERQVTRRFGWYTAATAVLGGLAAGLAHPPFGMLPGLLGYALILLRIDGVQQRPKRSAFGLGWLAGLGYFGVGVWWVVEPFMVDARTYGWMAPFGLAFLAGGLALFWGLAALLYRWLAPQGAWKVLVFAGVFAALEWVRGHIFTGFPWDLPGQSWRAGSAPSQAAAVVGSYGLTWITLALAAAPAVLMLPVRRLAQAATVAAAGLALVALYASGAGRLAAAGPPARQVEPQAHAIRVVQANIDQKDKWKPENLRQIFDTYVGLTQRASPRPPDLIVWPEGALPVVIDEFLADPAYAARLRDALRPGQVLLMGVNRMERAPGGDLRFFNSLLALRREEGALRVVGVYDKHRLVPFGEFLPLGDVATRIGVRSLVHMPEDFSAGPPPRSLSIPGAPPLQPLICYEALFPELAGRGPRPAWILNISNDAWFGQTSGPLQHLNIASYRAIEQGLPMVRSTPTGVSGVIDAYGRVRPQQRLGLGKLGVIDGQLPKALPATPYSRYGDAVFAAMLVVSAAAWLAGRRRRRA
jgi:apolipoprotein N-acyltransferase